MMAPVARALAAAPTASSGQSMRLGNPMPSDSQKSYGKSLCNATQFASAAYGR